MDLSPETDDLLAASLAPFVAVAGDRRTAALLGATVRGIVASETCSPSYRISL